jgi:hypothetical protein
MQQSSAANENWQRGHLPKEFSNELWVPHGVGQQLRQGGNQTPPPPTPPTDGPSDGGGGMTPLWKLDVRRDVQIAKWGVAALGTLFLAALLYLLGLIDSRFDRADDHVRELAKDVKTVELGIVEQRGDIKAILERVNETKSQTGPRAGSDGRVLSPTGGPSPRR